MEIALLGIGTSLFTELVSWLEKKASGTPLQGRINVLLVIAISFCAAAVQLAVKAGPFDFYSWRDILALASQIYAASQVWFYFISTKLGLEVKAE